jgi:hypothetical protein
MSTLPPQFLRTGRNANAKGVCGISAGTRKTVRGTDVEIPEPYCGPLPVGTEISSMSDCPKADHGTQAQETERLLIDT